MTAPVSSIWHPIKRIDAATANRAGWRTFGRLIKHLAPLLSSSGLLALFMATPGAATVTDLIITLIIGAVPGALASSGLSKSFENVGLKRENVQRATENVKLRQQCQSLEGKHQKEIGKLSRANKALRYTLSRWGVPEQPAEPFDGKNNIFKRVLGEGGLGIVVEVENYSFRKETGYPMAFKTLHPDILSDPRLLADATSRLRLREAEAMFGLQQSDIASSIVHLFENGEMSGEHYLKLLEQAGFEQCESLRTNLEIMPPSVPYILMELIEGETLEDKIKCGKLSIDEAVRIIFDMARTLQSINENGKIVHRDLKPENVFIVSDERSPGGYKIKIGDFGLAKFETEDPRKSTAGMTQVQQIMGSPHYMSPEQWVGAALVDWKTDQFAAGVMLYRMLSGKLPHVRDEEIADELSNNEIATRILSGNIIDIRKRVENIPEKLAEIIMKMMANKKEKRYEKWEDCIQALEKINGMSHARI